MHGRLKQTEKDQIMEKFRSHEYNVLISTTVIEVGVDIPGATIVLIESANHFGLAHGLPTQPAMAGKLQDPVLFLALSRFSC